MNLFHSVLSLRQRDRIAARLALRQEWVTYKVLVPYVVPIFLLFSVADWLAAPQISFWKLLALRTLVASIGIFFIFWSRGRVRYGLRKFIEQAPFTFYIEGFMIYHDLLFTPYFAGLPICLFTASLLFPVPIRVSTPVYFISIIPLVLSFALKIETHYFLAILGIAMSAGSALFCVVNAANMRREIIERLKVSHLLAENLRAREQEVRVKAEELVKRKQFERQFSPQVISEVLGNVEKFERLMMARICIMVCDIKDSTMKAQSLDPQAYSEVVEEVFDMISAGCLRWNITIDRFTGDGAQAFSGSPKTQHDDLERVINACREIEMLIASRRDYLELRWKGPLQLRYAVCEGDALVGFLGRGQMRSFTAIGTNVSLAHRLCGEAFPQTILAYSTVRKVTGDLFQNSSFLSRSRTIKGLKGFQDREFPVLELLPKLGSADSEDLGRCTQCSTPLVLLETKSGIPSISCPACQLGELSTQVKNR